jgi:NTE family protein
MARTAWVLSGGGSLGAVQVGMLQALSRAGLPVDLVVGASVGALNGAFFASNPTREGVDRLADLWRSLRRMDVFPLTLLAGLKALLFRRDHVIAASALERLIQRALHIQRIEEARVSLHIVSTDVMSGEEVLLSSGSLRTALLASSAIPVVFPAVRVGGHYLVDGGVSSTKPIAAAVRVGAERIIVLPTGMSCALPEPPRDMAALALHVLSLLSMRQLDRDVAHYASAVPISIVPPLCPLAVSALDFSQTASLIERTARQTADWVAAGGLEHTGPLHVPLAHHD